MLTREILADHTLIASVLPKRILREAVNAREMVFYHGTQSGPFDSFAPKAAAKGTQHWNPLGTALYVTDQPYFARYFGPNVHKVVIPPGYKYKRVTLREWQTSLGYNLVLKAVARALKKHGLDPKKLGKGTPRRPPSLRGKTPDELRTILKAVAVEAYRSAEEAKLDDAIAKLKDDELPEMIKNTFKRLPNDVDPADQAKYQEINSKLLDFKIAVTRNLRQNSPYEGLYEALHCVQANLSNELADDFEQFICEETDKVFGKYDFVIFTETNDVIGYDAGKGRGNRSALEVLIYNPALQRAVADDTRHRRYA